MNKLVRKEKKNNKGFSLVELIVVIAIMAVLVGVIAPQFLDYVNKSKRSTDITNAQNIASAIQASFADETPGLVADDKLVSAISPVLDGLTTVPGVKGKDDHFFYYTCTDKGDVKVSAGTAATPEAFPLYPNPGDYGKGN